MLNPQSQPVAPFRRTASAAWLLLLLACLAALGVHLNPTPPAGARASDKDTMQQGLYFAKKEYTPRALPTWPDAKDTLPFPIHEGQPVWIEMYWKAWELAFRNFHEPAPESGFVSPFIDAAFNENIFLWDTCFMTMFCNYAHPLVPGIVSLDNFYAKQHADGEICREIGRATGRDFVEWVNREDQPLFSRWGWHFGVPSREPKPAAVTYRGRKAPQPHPKLTLDALNHPILAWAEMESYRVTGDGGRLALIWEPLVRYYEALDKYLLQGNGLYVTDWASMDNATRNPYLDGGGMGVDVSAEMVLFARHLSEIAAALGKSKEARHWNNEASRLAGRINRKMWDAKRRFYFDLTLEGKQAPVKSVAGFWTLLAKVASPSQAEALAAELRNPETFNRLHRVPTLAADEEGYDPKGGYWRGAVWAPTTTMVVRGLEGYGYDVLAREIALNHLNVLAQVFQQTDTLWENYAPDAAVPGEPAKPDFVGWTGIGPIMFLLEYGLGLRPDAPRNHLTWTLEPGVRVGCERFRFGGHVVSLLAELDPANPAKIRIQVSSDGEFTLRVVVPGEERTFAVKAGEQEFALLP